MTHPWWPLFDLRIRTPRLELRLPTDEDLLGLVEAARVGIHGPDERPFFHPWEMDPSPGMERNVLQWSWGCRGTWKPMAWALPLIAVMLVDGHECIIGMQEINATNFAIRREVGSGSWLSQPNQGQGLGKEMRAAVLHLAFAGLGAQWATSTAHLDNPSSQAVSRARGYVEDGMEVELAEGLQRVVQRFRLNRTQWEARRPEYDIVIEALDPCKQLFGIG